MSHLLFPTIKQAAQSGQLFAVATVIRGGGVGRKLIVWPDGRVEGRLGNAALDDEVAARARDAIERQQSTRFSLPLGDEEAEFFIDVQVPPARLIVIGGAHIAIPLVTFANALGFHTIVLDARSAFATPERFPHVDELIIRWPADALSEMALDEACYIVALTHDAKLDDPALIVALNSPARYIGALGSRKTHAKRVESLRELGATEEQIARIHAPIGLDVGARLPEEIAVSIIAEIVAARNGALSD